MVLIVFDQGPCVRISIIIIGKTHFSSDMNSQTQGAGQRNLYEFVIKYTGTKSLIKISILLNELIILLDAWSNFYKQYTDQVTLYLLAKYQFEKSV